MAIYRIKISGTLDESWDTWLNKMKITFGFDENGDPTTIFSGPVEDQSELRGLLGKIWDLNIELISVKKINQDT